MLATPAMAWAAADRGVEVTAISERFDFSEYDDQGQRLVRENGWLGGGMLRFRGHYDRLYFAGDMSYLNGEVNYRGIAQPSGAEHKTITEETVQDFVLRLGRIYGNSDDDDYAAIYAGLGYHQWIRDIKTFRNVVGPVETYRWSYFNLGSRGSMGRWGDWTLMGQLDVFRTMGPTMRANFHGVEPAQTFNLGEHYGVRVSLPLRYHQGRRLTWLLEPYLVHWEFGRSPDIQLADEGQTSLLHEPRGVSQSSGLRFGFQMMLE